MKISDRQLKMPVTGSQICLPRRALLSRQSGEIPSRRIAAPISCGEKIPEPNSLRHNSGRFVVRTTPDMRRHLALAACEAGVGLNRYVNRSIPKSVHDYRIRENAEIFDFCLDAGQMAAIDWLGLPCGKGRTGKDPPVWPPMG